MRRVDDFVNALRRVLDRASPLVDSERDAVMDDRLAKVTRRVEDVHGRSIGTRIDFEKIAASYHRADRAVRR